MLPYVRVWGRGQVVRNTKKALKAGPTSLPVQQLPEELSIDLVAFCEAHYGASKARIVREALRLFIDTQLAEEPQTRKRFDQVKDRLSGQKAGVYVLNSKKDTDSKNR